MGVLAATRHPELRPGWKPLPGPQTLAYESKADILLFGGAAGGGKTDLQIGTALTKHRKSILFRRQFPQLSDVELRIEEIFEDRTGRYTAQRKRAITSDGRLLELGHCQYEKDKLNYKGRPHDLICLDEATEFTESQFRFLIGWLRTSTPDQRCRVIAGTNPPIVDEGQWVIDFWGPWLNDMHPDYPVPPGELRWFAMTKDGDLEVDGPESLEVDGKTVRPMSRTFIPASVEDNPYYMETGYDKVLENLPEPLRSALRYGHFSREYEEDPMAIIPLPWIDAAMARWTEKPPGPMTALGVDPNRGGKDKMVIAPKFGTNYIGKLVSYPGKMIKDGPDAAAVVEAQLPPPKAVNGNLVPPDVSILIDVIGIGSSPYDCIKSNQRSPTKVIALNSSERDRDATDRTGKFHFRNNRSMWLWKLREDLDPVYGVGMMLPPDRELRADLASTKWKITAQGIAAEDKDSVKTRIGRSPDRGDAVIYANSQGHETAWGAV